MYTRDYGRLGRIGLITPQANPTAEPEMQLLLPAGVSMLSSRCTSSGEPRQRFLDYFEHLDDSLASFDSLKLDAVGFACTASSYLIDPDDETRKVTALEDEYGYPLVTAAAAIDQALRFLGAKSIALACPYPQWLFELATDFWTKRGYLILEGLSVQPSMGDTRAIYDVSGAATGQQLIEAFGGTNADVFVITGTGMPGLQAIADLHEATGKPIINSTLCLAWACLKSAGIPLGEHAPSAGFPLLSGWKDEIRNL